MNIGQAAEASGVSAKMIRYYEKIGLVKAAARTAGGYRDYGAADLRILGFIRRARRLSFSTRDIKRLLALWQGNRPSAEVKDLALAHIAELDAAIADLRGMRDSLAALAHRCHGDDSTDCAILDGLAVADHPRRAEKATASSAARKSARALLHDS